MRGGGGVRQVRSRLTRRLFLAKPTFCPSLMELAAYVAELREVQVGVGAMPECVRTGDLLACLPVYREVALGTPAAVPAAAAGKLCGRVGGVVTNWGLSQTPQPGLSPHGRWPPYHSYATSAER